MPRRLANALGLALVAGYALACAVADPPASDGAARHLILVSIDTLRPDMLGAYGGARRTSPVLDSVAARGALFEQALSPAPWTLPAQASLLTGLYPSRHGLKTHDLRLDDATPTLAGTLAREGFVTAAVVGSHNLSQRYGLHRGFDHHVYAVESEQRRQPSEVETVAVEWLQQVRALPQRFFLFLHYYDVHSDYRSLPAYEQEFLRPYQGPADGSTAQLRAFREGAAKLGPEDRQRLVDLYQAGIRQMDDGLARLLAALDESGHAEDTLLVVTSDHGEEFFDHGGVLHGRTQFDDVLRVPLVLAGPGVPAGVRVADPVSLIDVMPTVLSLLGVPAPEGLDGTDLTPALRGEALPDRPLFGEADHGNERPDLTRSVRQGPWKAILRRDTGAFQLYDLRADPGEQRPVEQEHPEVARRLRAELEAFLAEEAPVDPDRRLELLGPEETERLKALGYL